MNIHSQPVVLQNLMLPDPGTCDIKRMFFRSRACVDYDSGCIVAPSPTSINFNCYFNAYPAQHWKEFLTVESFDLTCLFQGSAEFQLFECRPESSKPQLLQSATILSESCKTNKLFSNVSISRCSGYMYLVVNTHSPNTRLFNISAICHTYPKDISLAIVSCTFRREEAIRQNILSICALFDKERNLFKKSKYFVVNNDGVSFLDAPAHNKMEIIPNTNVGGSGGFTRGIIQAMNEGFTHVLLSDDDILLPAETLRRTMIVLSLLRDENMGVHGSMLELERKSVLHESGELFDIERRLHVNMNYGKEMTCPGNLKTIMFESYGMVRVTNMFGWWFTAIPMSFFRNCGLPLPLFVSGDDLEYSLRSFNNGYRAYISPTISIWHPSHMTQQAPLKKYFITRNRLAYSPLHASLKRVKKLLSMALREAWLLALTKRYATANAVCQGVEEFLSGTNWMYENIDDWTRRLKYLHLERADKIYRDEWTVPVNPIHRGAKKKESILLFILRHATFGGHIFSGFFHKPAPAITSPYHISLAFGVAPLGYDVTKWTFRTSSILYYDHQALVGFRVEHDNKKFWGVIIKLIKLRLKSYFVIRAIYHNYRGVFQTLISLDWWKNKLGLK